MDSVKEELSALRSNIKEKGDFSYYYAHKNNNCDLKDAKIFQGPGIVTGGQPILLHKGGDGSDDDNANASSRETEIKISKYSWSDRKDSIEIYIMKDDLPKMMPNEPEVTIQDKPKLEVTSNSILLEITANISHSSKIHKLILNITNLSNFINPQISRVKMSNKKITVICFKEDSDTKWFSLTKPT
ncbi:hypothetical protein FG386_001300 [Cryptosporidium ryanae]|uniref:uncharacterized protein n=1 Tax=Cryptosporidium ryanae TaxID=515981 RepID=UPI003519FCEF|nr:hypothetical protein FG386_001300 [Cryptosporidium ryanae]